MNRAVLFSIFIIALGCFLFSCSSKATYYSGSSQTGAFYNQLGNKTGGGGMGGFSISKRRYRQGRQIIANDVIHTLGISVMPGVGADMKYAYPTIGIHYSPRINLARWSWNGSFSLDFPMHLGISYGSDLVTRPNLPQVQPEKKANFTAEIPITLNFNFGQAATKRSTANFGAFFGVGFSFAYLPTGRTGIFNNATNQATFNDPIGFGPHGRAGIRFRTGTISWQMYTSFMYNIYQPSHLFGVGVGLNFGRW